MKRATAAETFARDLGSLYRARQMYPAGNALVLHAARRACAALERVGEAVRVAGLGAQVVVQDQVLDPPPRATRSLLEAMRELGREGLHVDPESAPRSWSTGSRGSSAAPCGMWDPSRPVPTGWRSTIPRRGR